MEYRSMFHGRFENILVEDFERISFAMDLDLEKIPMAQRTAYVIGQVSKMRVPAHEEMKGMTQYAKDEFSKWNEHLTATHQTSLSNYERVAARGFQCFTYDYKEGDVHTMSDMIMLWAYIRWLIAELVDDDDLPDNVKNLLNGDGYHM